MLKIYSRYNSFTSSKCCFSSTKNCFIINKEICYNIFMEVSKSIKSKNTNFFANSIVVPRILFDFGSGKH